MKICRPSAKRELKEERLSVDLVVVGGGMAGVCCSITAARAGIKVVLVQDRPVLGGNASSEIRLWMLGATSHMGNNNRWAREGGVFNEICVENTFRNREGNPVILDTILLEKVTEEENLTLLLNSAVYDLEKSSDGNRITSVRAFCSQNSTQYCIEAPLFCDSSGDGVVAFMAGAPFRYGAEARQEFGELLASSSSHTNLLGQSLFFYTRDTGNPVRFVPPKYALDDITKIPRYRQFSAKDYGCQLWWIEYGGKLDTVHKTETIKWELWKVVYGVWNHIKNSGEFPEAETMTLDWVGTIPGKRESRRFEGDYILVQQDIVEQRTHYDAVSYGGWAIDQHPVDNIYSDESPCTQWHSKGVYQIPYRTMYSRSIDNLFLAGRILSASHIAFCSSRVMATCAHNGQAVGMAAALCRREGVLPRHFAHPDSIGQLQQALLKEGQYIPGCRLEDEEDLAQTATVTASSQFQLSELRLSDRMVELDVARALLVPLRPGKVPTFEFDIETSADAKIEFQLRTCSRVGSYTPDRILETLLVPVEHSLEPKEFSEPSREGGKNGQNGIILSKRNAVDSDITPTGQIAVKESRTMEATEPQAKRTVRAAFNTRIEVSQYAFVCVMENPDIRIAVSDQLTTGVLSVARKHNHRVAKGSMQTPPESSGIDRFEFWTPERRPQGQNLATRIEPSLRCFGPEMAVNGLHRPVNGPNAWVAATDDPTPTIELLWTDIQTIGRIELVFDTDLDHPMESVVMHHHDAISPYCVREYRILGFKDQEVWRVTGNYQARNTIQFENPIHTDSLKIELISPSSCVPAALFEVRCYAS